MSHDKKMLGFADTVLQHVQQNVHQSLHQTFQTVMLELNTMKAKMKTMEDELQALKHKEAMRSQREMERASYIV